MNGWKGALLKDWTFSGNINVRSGNPFTATVGGNRSQVGGTAVSNTSAPTPPACRWKPAGLLFNTAAFSAPLAGQWGNAGRNTIPGPTRFRLNGSLGRIFRFGERRSADLQFQAQNLLNHVTITNWGTVLGSTNYGLATVRRRHAQDHYQFEVQVLTYAITHCHPTHRAVCRLRRSSRPSPACPRGPVSSKPPATGGGQRLRQGQERRAAGRALKASDFTVTEDGKTQQIKVFEFQRLEEAPMPAPEAAPASQRRLPRRRKRRPRPIAPAKAGEVKYKDRRLLVLFFDQAGMPVADQIRAQQAALKFLNTRSRSRTWWPS